MLAADGRSRENPAVGFRLRDERMPLPCVDNTVRVLVGTQIACAQCHDHPFDRCTHKPFYDLATLTTGTRMRIDRGKMTDQGRELPDADVRRRLADIIVLTMRGAMTHIDMFDPKPGRPEQGETKTVRTKTPASCLASISRSWPASRTGSP